MRKVIGYVFLLLGAFALVAAAVAGFWAKDAVAKTPLDVDSHTVLEGTASGALAKSETPVTVGYVNNTKADPKASDDDTVVMIEQACIVVQKDNPPECPDPKKDDRAVNISETAFALDRKNAEPVKDQAAYVGEDRAIDGISGFVSKFPFGTDRHDYEYWDDTLGKSVIATYVDDVEVRGVKTYKFEVSIPATEAALSKGETDSPDDDTMGTYEATQTIFVEPTTGQYIDQSGTQKMVAGETTLLDIEVSYTDETVAKNAEDAKANVKKLTLIGSWLPVGGLVAGLVLLLVGLWLVLSGRKRNGGSHTAADDRTLVDA
ncbi:DUF3068 family protein [Nocardioides albertanoniae]|uniref:DUF3068 family protein n=1 Tax=Nocardioides albertanoniae TaxID=1175486 RepID=A0A543A971_9ACTN|nr:DUF3068 domain-containing protein [Nocardioides albertanoniae]TQL69162.1 DUF3068 family protein [Nocardioides albertanoniae]